MSSIGRRSAGAALDLSVGTDRGVDECDGVSSSFFRRTKSAGRLLGLCSPPGGLNEAIDQMIIVTKLILRAADAQRKAAAALEAHALYSNNAAMADVGKHQADLLKMDADHATQAAEERRYYIKELRKINEAEKEIKEARMGVPSLYKKQAKIAESLLKERRRSDNDTVRKGLELQKVIEKAEIELKDKIKEKEVITMLRYRRGMLGIADSAISHASTSSAIFGCFRELTEMVPAISTEDVTLMKYDGAAITHNCVARLRGVIASPSSLHLPSQLMGAPSRRRNRHSGGARGSRPAAPSHAPHSLHVNSPSTPPPPYTPTAPTKESEFPQQGCSGGAATVPDETASNQAARSSPPRFASLYPKLPANPYRRSGPHN